MDSDRHDNTWFRVILHTVNLMLIVYHRQSIYNHLTSALQQLPTALTVFQKSSRVFAQSDRTQEKVEQLRMRYFHWILEHGQFMLVWPITIVSFKEVLGFGASINIGAQIQLLLLSVYVMIGTFNFLKIRIRAQHINIFVTIVFVVYCCRLLLFDESPVFFLSIGMRLCLRIFLGLLLMDIRLSVWSGTVLSIAVCLKCPQNASAFSAKTLEQYNITMCFIVMELGSLLLCSLLLAAIEKSFRDRICETADMRAAKRASHAVRQLLSVLCDAEVHLGADLRIIGPSQKLSYLLLSGSSVHNTTNVEGVSFNDFVAEHSQERFLSFLQAFGSANLASDFTDDGVPTNLGPPSSLHLDLQNAAGVVFSAELFHAFLPDINNQLGHLIGIRASDSELHRRDATEHGEPEAIGRMQAFPRIDLQPGTCTQSKTADQSEVRSESSSSSPSLSPSERARLDLPEISRIEVEVDAASKRFVVRELLVSFLTPKANVSMQLPEFADWLSSPTWHSFEIWSQGAMNAQYATGSSSPSFGPVVLQWPSQSQHTPGLFLEAASTKIEVSDFDTLIATIAMEGFTQISSVGRHRRGSRRAQPKSLIQLSSISEGRGRGSPGKGSNQSSSDSSGKQGSGSKRSNESSSDSEGSQSAVVKGSNERSGGSKGKKDIAASNEGDSARKGKQQTKGGNGASICKGRQDSSEGGSGSQDQQSSSYSM